MAYDSEIYGQSPFGNVPKPKGAKKDGPNAAESNKATPPVDNRPIDDGLDQGPTATTPANPPTEKVGAEKAVGKWMGKLGLKKGGNSVETDVIDITANTTSAAAGVKTTAPIGTTKTNSRTTAKTSTSKTAGKSSKKSTRKSKKTKASKAAQAEAAAAEEAIARRFREEDRSTYLSLLYKTGISALVWAVLRLSRHEFADDVDRIINIIIHPLLIALVALLSLVGLTFWLRQLLNDLARHTQQLSTDAEETEGKNYRPTLDIVGDSLEYNPQLRKSFAALFNATSILVCALISYLIVFTAFP